MKYISVILIIIALLNNQYMFNAENTVILNADDEKSIEQKEKTPELDATQKWNNHLELLKTGKDYWDTSSNNPTSYWKNTAFDLAEKVLQQDSSAAEILKTSFVDALNTKTTKFNDINDLIDEFKDFIKEKLSATETKQDQEKEIVSTPTMPEIVVAPVVAQEPVSEPVPVTTETPAYSGETITTSTTQAADLAQPKNLTSEWKTVLESIKQDESVGISINKAYELTRELLLSGQGNPRELEKEFNDALTTRMLQKKLDPTIVNNERAYFKMNIAQQLQPTTPQTLSYPTLPTGMPINIEQQQALEKLQAEYAQKDMKLKEELEKQHKKEEQERMKLLAAAAKAEQEGALVKEQLQQIHHSAQAEKERKRLVEEALKEELAQITKAREELSKNIQQIAQAQKASAEKAEKGIFSTFTDAISNWWYGPSAAKPAELTAKKQEEFLEALVQNAKDREAAKQKFKEFQQTLLNFNALQFWDAQKEMPNDTWIQHMQILMKDIVIQHELISLDELAKIVENVIRTRVRNYPKIIAAIKKSTLEEQAKEKQVMLEKQNRIDRRRERKEQIILAQQKIKEEKARKLAEENRHKENIMRYKSEKNGWYDLLYQVASNKKATHQDNHEHTQEALQKSQSLLQLAGEIPTKNRSALSQKLKQKFTVALLEQQKRNRHDLNIYHNMDIFNGGVNKMME